VLKMKRIGAIWGGAVCAKSAQAIQNAGDRGNMLFADEVECNEMTGKREGTLILQGLAG
jgi:hypothetical protein